MHRKVIKDLGKQVKKMRRSQTSTKSVEKLSKEVEKISSAGDLPLDLLIEQPVPAAEAAADHSEEPVANAHTFEEMIQMLSNPVVPQPGDDDIQLEETEGADDPMQTETTYGGVGKITDKASSSPSSSKAAHSSSSASSSSSSSSDYSGSASDCSGVLTSSSSGSL
nr:Krueppel-like factor 12 [Nicotiana tomentosiformis]